MSYDDWLEKREQIEHPDHCPHLREILSERAQERKRYARLVALVVMFGGAAAAPLGKMIVDSMRRVPDPPPPIVSGQRTAVDRVDATTTDAGRRERPSP